MTLGVKEADVSFLEDVIRSAAQIKQKLVEQGVVAVDFMSLPVVSGHVSATSYLSAFNPSLSSEIGSPTNQAIALMGMRRRRQIGTLKYNTLPV